MHRLLRHHQILRSFPVTKKFFFLFWVIYGNDNKISAILEEKIAITKNLTGEGMLVQNFNAIT